MVCENCKQEHEGSYGSGRFCSSKCARGFSTKDKRTEINEKVSRALSGRTVTTTTTTTISKIASRERARKVSETWRKKRERTKSERPFEEWPDGVVREAIFEEQSGCCNKCGLDRWGGDIIPLELEHKDGNNTNNARDNLELLCPNCHAQTGTWRGRNKGRPGGGKKVSDGELLKSLNETFSIRQALIRVGLSPKGGNYLRAKRMLGTMADTGNAADCLSV